LAALPEEQRPIAELALQGIAAVRQRLREDNARLKAEGKPEMPEVGVMRMAEELIPRLRVADWLDRAEAAQRQLEHLDLRDLRSVVASADDPLVARDESTRALASELKSSLSAKQDEEFSLWLGDVEAAVDVGRVVRALRLSAEPPKAGVPFPSALGSKLGSATIAALSTDDPPERWITVLEAAAFSPVRTLVTPAAAPAQRTPELVATVTRLGPLLPQVAALFEIEVPDKAPAPKPLRPAPRKKEPARKAAAKPVPPAAKAAPAEKPAQETAQGEAVPPEPVEPQVTVEVVVAEAPAEVEAAAEVADPVEPPAADAPAEPEAAEAPPEPVAAGPEAAEPAASVAAVDAEVPAEPEAAEPPAEAEAAESDAVVPAQSVAVVDAEAQPGAELSEAEATDE
jgi:hypothetical protein